MTAAIKVNPNASAIGPSLFDRAREKWEAQERQREAQDAAFEDHFNLWRQFSYVDRECPNAKAEIAEVMGEAMSDLYADDEDSARFDHALFALYCSGGDQGAKDALHELLDKHVRAAVRKEWSRERRIAA